MSAHSSCEQPAGGRLGPPAGPPLVGALVPKPRFLPCCWGSAGCDRAALYVHGWGRGKGRRSWRPALPCPSACRWAGSVAPFIVKPVTLVRPVWARRGYGLRPTHFPPPVRGEWLVALSPPSPSPPPFCRLGRALLNWAVYSGTGPRKGVVGLAARPLPPEYSLEGRVRCPFFLSSRLSSSDPCGFGWEGQLEPGESLCLSRTNRTDGPRTAPRTVICRIRFCCLFA